MKRGLFLYNPESGRGRIARNVEAIVTIFRDAGYELQPRAIDFKSDPFDADSASLALVVVAGGDGTVNFVVNRMKAAGLDLLLGIIPAGTANDFARSLGFSNHLLKAAHQVATGEETHIDLGRVNDLYFVNVFSFGVFTTTSQRTPNELKHRIGKLAYLIEGVKEVAELNSLPLEVRADGQSFDLNSRLVLVFNGATAGGFRFVKRTSLTDGMFDVLMLEKRNLVYSGFAVWGYLLSGKSRLVHQFKVRELDIDSSVDALTDVDGQPGAHFPLHIECLRGALRILCPREEETHHHTLLP